MHLDPSETKKINDKSSVVYKALQEVRRLLKKATGMTIGVIGTKPSGELFVIDMED